LTAFLDVLISNPRAEPSVGLEVRLHTSSRYGELQMAQLLKAGEADCEKAGIRLVHRY